MSTQETTLLDVWNPRRLPHHYPYHQHYQSITRDYHKLVPQTHFIVAKLLCFSGDNNGWRISVTAPAGTRAMCEKESSALPDVR